MHRLAALLCLFTAAHASAAQRTARLEYTRATNASDCPDLKAVQNRIAARLGYNPFRPDASLLITVDVSRENGLLRALIGLRRGDQSQPRSRELTSNGSDCAELTSAVELAVSIAIDPLDATRSTPRVPVTTAPNPRTPTLSLAGRGSAIPAAPTEPAKWVFGVGLIGGVGFAPSWSAGFVLEARLRWSRISLGLEARADVPTRAPLLEGSVVSSLLGATLSPCVHFGPVSACAVVAGGALRTSAEGFTTMTSVWSPHLAAGARAGVELPLSARFSLRAQAELLVRLIRVTLEVDQRQAWVSAPVSGSLAILAVATF